VLTIDPLPLAVGGGGTTLLGAPVVLPLANRRRSRELSVEGGGATTDGAGSVNVEFLTLSLSGADTGGGTTATLSIRICDRATSGPAAAGAGGITLPAIAGAERERLCETFEGAGAITLELRAGATSE
jgi:hypothetical protein